MDCEICVIVPAGLWWVIMWVGSSLLYHAQLYRIVNFCGGLGTYKTIGAIALAVEMWRRRFADKIFTNMRSFDGDEFSGELSDAIVIMDEAWTVLDSRMWSSKNTSIGAYLRKRNIYLILPSVTPIDVRFRAITVRSVARLGWAVVYEVKRADEKRELNYVTLLNPQKYYSTYDTKEIPDEDVTGRLVDALKGKYKDAGVRREVQLYDPDDFSGIR